MIVNLFGFFIDWMITRRWRQIILLLAPPLISLVCVLVTGTWGALLNKDVLASKYLAIGERELRDTDEDWAFDLSFLTNDENASSSGDDSEPEKKSSRVSRYTTALFQRALQLQGDNLRTTFVIGSILGQQGALANAIATMKKIAPDDGVGYAPAHAWIANLMLMQKPFPKEQEQVLRHHLSLGTKWDHAPASLFVAESQLALNDNNPTAAIDWLRKAGEKQPELKIELFRLAVKLENESLAKQTAETLLPRLLSHTTDGTATAADLIDLADIQFYLKNDDAARGALEEGLKSNTLSESDRLILRRALSDFYRLQFIQSLQVKPDSWTADIRLLDQAMRSDPTNPLVAEEVAKLARIGGNKPPDELIAKLNDFLAQGTATPVTHAWMAEAYILRTEFPKAIEHLETLLQRMPEAAHSHNNLAYAIALSQPERMEEALKHAQTAVTINPRNADFHDTLGFILLKLDRKRDAITEIEIAIELNPQRADYHERAAEAYRLLGDEQTAQSHMNIVQKLTSPPSTSEEKEKPKP